MTSPQKDPGDQKPREFNPGEHEGVYWDEYPDPPWHHPDYHDGRYDDDPNPYHGDYSEE